MTDAGLVLGDGSVLIRMSKGEGAPSLDADRDRFAALMSVVGDRPVAPDTLKHIEAADRFWQRGDKALANLRLIFAGLPRLATLTDAYRLTLAAHLLDDGMTPDALTKELGLELATTAIKYAPDQARIPAGHGRESGQFTFGHESTDAPEARIDLASEDDNPADDPEYLEHQGQSVPTPRKGRTTIIRLSSSRDHRRPIRSPCRRASAPVNTPMDGFQRYLEKSRTSQGSAP